MTIRQATATMACMLLIPLASLALGGCGGGTKTVTVSSASEPAAGTTSPTASRTSTRPTSAASTDTTTTSGGAQQSSGATASTTRTAPEPAFAQHAVSGSTEASDEEAAAAVAAVKTHGYTPDDVSQYRSNQTLRVLVGTRTGSADGYDQRAFFFVDGKYLGTDSSQPSASLRVVSQSDTEVVLAYALYRPHDPLCCGTGGQSIVHFQLNNGQLVPLQPIPPASSAAGLNRQ